MAPPKKGSDSSPPKAESKLVLSKKKPGKSAKPGKAPKAHKHGPTPFAWRTELAVVVGGAVAGVALAFGIMFLDARREVSAWMDKPRQTTPTDVWSAPVHIIAGDPYPASDLIADLLSAGYERADDASKPGHFVVDGSAVEVNTGALEGPGFVVKAGRGVIHLQDGRVSSTEPKSGVTLRPVKLATLGDLESKRTPVTLAKLSPFMAPALLAIEDSRFREHSGVDPIGLVRAIFQTVVRGDTQGGSTLTQQLAKNLFLSRERTARRKVREVFYAAALESLKSKDELLELYLSEVYLGSVEGMPIHGAEEAARAWFGKSAASLSAGEAATIAGTIASPNQWSPLRDPDAAVTRRNQVIDRMVYVRALTEAQAEAARAEPIATVSTRPTVRWKAPWAVDAALDVAGDMLGDAFSPDRGLEIHTTIQPHLQRAAETAVTDGVTALITAHPKAQDLDAALVSLDVGSGDVLALVGGRDWVSRPFNRAVDARRQAGSTVKPLLVLAAMDADPSLSAATVYDDAPLTRTVDGKSWSPKDHDGAFMGPISLRRAVEQSRNIPAILMSERLGLKKMEAAFHADGLAHATDWPSAALGSFPATPLEIAGAYSAFPGGGLVDKPRLVTGLADARGRTIATQKPSSVRVAKPVSSALVTRILEGVLTDGTARRSATMGIHGAFGGKTGTTDNERDAWFVGFDPSVVTAVWVGRDEVPLGLTGGEAALPIWAAYTVASGAPRGHFPSPDGLVDIEVCATDDLPPCPSCAATRHATFRADAVPTRDCTVAPPADPPLPAPPADADPVDMPPTPRVSGDE